MVKLNAPCPICHGTGYNYGQLCPICKGTGEIQLVMYDSDRMTHIDLEE